MTIKAPTTNPSTTHGTTNSGKSCPQMTAKRRNDSEHIRPGSHQPEPMANKVTMAKLISSLIQFEISVRYSLKCHQSVSHAFRLTF